MRKGVRTERLTDIEPDDLEEIVVQYELVGSTSVTAVRQPDGKWTVTAIVPVDE